MSLSIFVTYEPDGSPPVSGRSERRLNLMVSHSLRWRGADLMAKAELDGHYYYTCMYNELQ